MMHGGVSEKTWKKITQGCASFPEAQRVLQKLVMHEGH